MEITDVRIRSCRPEGRLRAIASVTVDGCLAVHDIRLIQGDDRLFAAMPSRRGEHGGYRDVVHPISPDARAEIERSIIAEYERSVALSPEPQNGNLGL